MSASSPASLSPPRRRWFAPRFSLAAALVMLTLCAIGLWYWYRVPFEVVHDWPAGEDFPHLNPKEDQYREVETIHRAWGGGTVRHGPRQIYLNDHLRFVERYREGIPHGRWEWLDDSGRATITAELRFGRITDFQASSRCDQRLARLLAEGKIADPQIARALLEDSKVDFMQTPLRDAMAIIQDFYGVPIQLTAMMRVPNFSIDMPITCKGEGLLIETLGDILQPHGLVCDYRYGMLYIVEQKDVENWKDETGMTDLSPPGSRMEKLLDGKSVMEFIETPLVDALQILKDAHGVEFDWSRLPAELVQLQSPSRINVTINISGISLRNGLGALFDAYDLQARLDGEKLGIVIELQPDHPAAQER